MSQMKRFREISGCGEVQASMDIFFSKAQKPYKVKAFPPAILIMAFGVFHRMELIMAEIAYK
jgi:Na+-translocating ferredoxin:NAD+ oxidoreductase RnfE subunit